MNKMFGGNSNLPPGCSVSDLPGNSPTEAEWEHLIEDFWDTKRINNRQHGIPISPQEKRTMALIFRAKKYQNLTNAINVYIEMAIEYGMGCKEREMVLTNEQNRYFEADRIGTLLEKCQKDILNIVKGFTKVP